MRIKDALRDPRIATPVLTVALAGTACSSGSTPTVENPYLRFDDLGGGSPIIQVYPGPGDTDREKVYNGTFRDGQSVAVICHATGRMVLSHPEVGEASRHSTDWYLLVGEPPRYASGTYAAIEPAGAVVPECPTPLPGAVG